MSTQSYGTAPPRIGRTTTAVPKPAAKPPKVAPPKKPGLINKR